MGKLVVEVVKSIMNDGNKVNHIRCDNAGENTHIKQPAAINLGYIRDHTRGLGPLTDTPFEDLGERLQSAPASE